MRRVIKRHARWVAAALLIVVTAFCGVSARLFIWPPTGAPAHVDAIVVLGGQGGRLDLGLRLAGEGRSRYLLLSEGLPWIPPRDCGSHWPIATVICFRPVPDTTQGEAEAAARIARQYGWHSILLITTPDQIWRAELRFRRCFADDVYGLTATLPGSRWPYEIAYQWAATVKAEAINRSC
jgi:uncharacterized SAM-binding protein YcdF (DUF218 family)